MNHSVNTRFPESPVWLDSNEYPFRSRYLEMDGHRLHYIDEGEGDPILFVHGTPSWSFEYRNVIRQLRRQNRCIAVDHIGFGLSDKPEDYDYSTIRHSVTLKRFIEALDLKSFTLVVHDFGGPIGLNIAIEHPEIVSGIVILNSWLWSSESDPDFIKLSRILKSPLLPFLYRYLNFSARMVLPKSFGDKKLSGRIHKHYTSPFSDRTQRNGTIAFAKSLLNDQDWFEELWTRKQTIEDKPVLFIWGMKDPVIRSTHLEKFQSGFPNSEVVPLPTAGHFPQEEEPELVAGNISIWLSAR